MKIAVIGSGYVGLVTGTCFAETGNEVICVDIDEQKVESLKNGKIPIYEPDLDVLFKRNTSQGRLTFTTNLKQAVEFASIIFLALPTPPGEDGSADLSYILSVAKEMGPLLNEYKVVVDKSTVPIGTAELVTNAIAKNANHPFDVVSNPEFLREGVAVEDFLRPDRVVIGTSSERAKKAMEALYKPFLRSGNPIVYMDERSAEMTKYAANSYLATRISFINEISNLCEELGANVEHVRLGIGHDHRIGTKFLMPGIGYGGSCFPKDVSALVQMADKTDYHFNILKSVMKVNADQQNRFVNKIDAFYSNDLKGKTFAIWGLAFKPNTDDIREAPATKIIGSLLEKGAKLNVYDPEAMDNFKNIYSNEITYCDGHYEALENADALLILTEWGLFRNPDFEKIAKLLNNKVIFDGRNIYSVQKLKELGFTYLSMGRPTLTQTN